jgi:hypothetical protein
MAHSHKFHVHLGELRTTVSLDKILSELLAIKLGVAPDAPEARATVRKWLQARLDAFNDPVRIRVSQSLRASVIEAVVAPSLASAHAEWTDKIISAA